MDVSSHVASKIKYFRQLNKMTQKELGEKVGVAHNTISSYESGTNEPEQDMLFKLAQAFNISINDLFPPISTDNSNRNKTELLAAHIDDDVTEDQMDDILKYIDFIKSQNK